MLVIWTLVRLLSEGKKDNESLTALNLSNAGSDLENGNSSCEAVAGPEPSVGTSFEEFFETYYRKRWSTNDVLRFLRIFLTTTCYSAPEGSVELATYFFARISKDRRISFSNTMPQVSGGHLRGICGVFRTVAASHNSVNFLGDGTIFWGDGTRIQAFSEAAGGFHEQFRWNEAQRGTPRPGGALGSEVVGMETAFVTGRRDRRRP